MFKVCRRNFNFTISKLECEFAALSVSLSPARVYPYGFDTSILIGNMTTISPIWMINIHTIKRF